MSEKGRPTYVTPSSYLQLLYLLKKSLNHYEADLLSSKKRYLTGIEKIEFAASQVICCWVYEQYSINLYPLIIALMSLSLNILYINIVKLYNISLKLDLKEFKFKLIENYENTKFLISLNIANICR